MMPRFYSPGENINSGGWSRRRAAAIAIAAQAEARRSDPTVQAIAQQRQAVRDQDKLQVAVGQAEHKRDELVAKLASTQAQAGRLDEAAFQTGTISEATSRVAAQLRGLPSLIIRAENELAAAREALARHRATMAEAAAALVEPAPTPTTKKGRQQ